MLTPLCNDIYIKVMPQPSHERWQPASSTPCASFTQLFADLWSIFECLTPAEAPSDGILPSVQLKCLQTRKLIRPWRGEVYKPYWHVYKTCCITVTLWSLVATCRSRWRRWWRWWPYYGQHGAKQMSGVKIAPVDIFKDTCRDFECFSKRSWAHFQRCSLEVELSPSVITNTKTAILSQVNLTECFCALTEPEHKHSVVTGTPKQV